MIILQRRDIENMIRNVVNTAFESLEPEQKLELLQELIQLLEQIQDEIE